MVIGIDVKVYIYMDFFVMRFFMYVDMCVYGGGIYVEIDRYLCWLRGKGRYRGYVWVCTYIYR